jgi:hypothetical protein
VEVDVEGVDCWDEFEEDDAAPCCAQSAGDMAKSKQKCRQQRMTVFYSFADSR